MTTTPEPTEVQRSGRPVEGVGAVETSVEAEPTDPAGVSEALHQFRERVEDGSSKIVIIGRDLAEQVLATLEARTTLVSIIDGLTTELEALRASRAAGVSEREDAVPHPMARCIHCGQMHVEHDRVGNAYICAGPTGVHFQAALRTPPVLEVVKEALIDAYKAGASDVHMHLSGKEVEREADFTEAAHDYAEFAFQNINERSGS